jgi:leader peptidase (prepilin peptidase) / N-methyltransferase
LTQVSVLLPVGAALLAGGCAWPAARLVRAYAAPVPVSLVPLLAVAMAAIAVAATQRLQPWPVALAACWLGVCGAPLAAIDAAVRRLPDVLTGAAFAGVAACLALAAGLYHGWPDLGRAGAGAAAVAGFFLLLAVARPGSAGLGDAKLGLGVGALAAWMSWGTVLAAVFAAFVLAALVALALIVSRRAGLSSSVPFGPFLLAGCLAAVLLAGHS